MIDTEVKQTAQKNGHLDTESGLQRTHFSTSRLLEFFSETELTMQIGHPEHLWSLALAKELIDNAMDACEKARIRPAVRITVEPDALTVADNGPGLPEMSWSGPSTTLCGFPTSRTTSARRVVSSATR
jgi:hypothetical protein